MHIPIESHIKLPKFYQVGLDWDGSVYLMILSNDAMIPSHTVICKLKPINKNEQAPRRNRLTGLHVFWGWGCNPWNAGSWDQPSGRSALANGHSEQQRVYWIIKLTNQQSKSVRANIHTINKTESYPNWGTAYVRVLGHYFIETPTACQSSAGMWTFDSTQQSTRTCMWPLSSQYVTYWDNLSNKGCIPWFRLYARHVFFEAAHPPR